MIAVRLFVSGHGRFVTAEQAFEYFPVGEAVGAVGKNDDAFAVQPEQAIKSFDRSLSIAERRIGLFDLLDPRSSMMRTPFQ